MDPVAQPDTDHTKIDFLFWTPWVLLLFMYSCCFVASLLAIIYLYIFRKKASAALFTQLTQLIYFFVGIVIFSIIRLSQYIWESFYFFAFYPRVVLDSCCLYLLLMLQCVLVFSWTITAQKVSGHHQKFWQHGLGGLIVLGTISFFVFVVFAVITDEKGDDFKESTARLFGCSVMVVMLALCLFISILAVVKLISAIHHHLQSKGLDGELAWKMMQGLQSVWIATIASMTIRLGFYISFLFRWQYSSPRVTVVWIDLAEKFFADMIPLITIAHRLIKMTQKSAGTPRSTPLLLSPLEESRI